MRRINRITGHVAAGFSSQQSLHPDPVADDQPFTVTILGGGNSGHVCAALFHENLKGNIRTNLLTTHPEEWSKTPTVTFPDGTVQQGLLHQISDDPAVVLRNCDMVIWTGPVFATKEAFEKLRPHFNVRRTAVGVIFAQGLIHLLAQRTFGPNVRFFALRNIPWLCRKTKLGHESEIVGPKSSIGVMTMNLDDDYVKHTIEPLFVVQKTGKWKPVCEVLPDFCPIVFNPANQIIHPARYWAMFRFWNGKPLSPDQEPPEFLYRGMDEVAGQVLEVLDEELQSLKDAYYSATGAKGCHEVISLRERLTIQYGDQIKDNSTLAKMVGTNQAYSAAKTPVDRTKLGVMPAKNHRVVHDDIGWGLCVLVSIAERLETAGIKTPTTMMRMLIEWHQEMMGKEFLYNGRLRGRDCPDLTLLRPSDDLELVAKPPGSAVNWLRSVEEVGNEDRIGNP